MAINGGASQLISHAPGPRFKVTGDFEGQPMITGAIVSRTVTVDTQLPTLLHSSVAVIDTWFGPMFAQVN
jgi:hypothetical protein